MALYKWVANSHFGLFCSYFSTQRAYLHNCTDIEYVNAFFEVEEPLYMYIMY